MTVAAVLVAGGAGAVLRWLVTSAFGDRPGAFPVGTTVVNVFGSFVIGFGYGYGFIPDHVLSLHATVGLLGGFTTFSTWMVAADRTDGTSSTVVVLVVPVIAGLAGVTVGMAIGSALA